MDSEILASERAHHRRFRAIYNIALLLVLSLAAVGLVYASFAVNARAGWVTTLGLLLIAVAVLLMWWRMDRTLPNELSSTGPWSFGQVYSGSARKDIWNSMGKVIVRNSMSFTRITRETGMCERPGSFLYRKGSHLLDVRPSQDHPGWFVISVFSSPDLPTTITDFGRGRGINSALLEAVPGYRRPDDPELRPAELGDGTAD